MITFLLGFTLGTIFGAAGLVCVVIMYDKHTQTNEAVDIVKGGGVE